MNKFTKQLILSGLTMFSATFAFAQTPKSCDLQLTLTAPAANAVFAFGDTVNIGVTIKNNGPAAIAATDTIFLNPVGTTQALPITGVTIAVGGTTTEAYTLPNTNETGTDETFDLCLAILPLSSVTIGGNPATITYTDPNTANDQDCRSITLKTKPVSIFDAKTAKETLSLYPNPATSKVGFSIALDKAENVSAIVRDITGREVMTKNFGQIQSGTSTALELNVANLNNGIYVVEVVAGDKKFIGKVTKKD